MNRTANEITYMSEYELRRYKRLLRIRRERRKKLYFTLVAIVATLCLVLGFSISQGSIRTNANTGFKYFTQYFVEAGDTLWEIADEYIDYDYYKNKKTYLEEVRNINHLSSDEEIYSGQMLILPYYSSEYVF